MGNTKSWSGCWTCRVRHKKCDETFPQCQTCTSLLITCYYTEEKPAWMDNGDRQREMVNSLKREVREKAAMRRTLGYMREAEDAGLRHRADDNAGVQYSLPHRGSSHDAYNATHQPTAGAVAAPAKKVWPGCDAGFMSYYLDFFFPFLFPFYQPHMLEGGRSWLLEFLNEAEGMQEAVMAFSSYLFTLVLDASEAGHEFCIKINWDKLLAEMSNTFTRLRADVQTLAQTRTDSPAELSKAVRILGVITHLQRFEISTAGFANSKLHLDAAVQTFRTILDVDIATTDMDIGSRFFNTMARLGPSPWPKPYLSYQITSPEQVAFRFFASILVADDIVASTSLAEKPRLYDHLSQLMADEPEDQSAVNLEVITGCQNGVMLQIGEISALAAWKRQNTSQDNLLSEVVRRGNIIKDTLETRLELVTQGKHAPPKIPEGVLRLFMGWQEEPKTPATNTTYVTQIWAHAALMYVLVTMHGFDPANPETRKHVAQVMQIVDQKLASPVLLRTVVWPFCVAGCLAEPEHRPWFRHQAKDLQPSGLFVTVRKALEIMESIWARSESNGKVPVDIIDMASCFATTGEVLFLI